MEDKLKFSPLHLRRQMVAHFIQNKDLLYDIVKEGLIENYGLPPDPNGEGDTQEEEQVGPFSIVSYMKVHCCKQKVGRYNLLDIDI